jgi:small GTP-binding protein
MLAFGSATYQARRLRSSAEPARLQVRAGAADRPDWSAPETPWSTHDRAGSDESRHEPHIRNVAIIAHVDHGKTTLVDAMLRQSGAFREGAEVVDRVMDSMDLEREGHHDLRQEHGGPLAPPDGTEIKINIVDTPGHADFGGEVERGLAMVDGVVLLVDAAEGPLPRPGSCSEGARADLPVVLVVNKIDRADARPAEVVDEVYELFLDLDAHDHQIDFPIIYSSARRHGDARSRHARHRPAAALHALADRIPLRPSTPPPRSRRW